MDCNICSNIYQVMRIRNQSNNLCLLVTISEKTTWNKPTELAMPKSAELESEAFNRVISFVGPEENKFFGSMTRCCEIGHVIAWLMRRPL